MADLDHATVNDDDHDHADVEGKRTPQRPRLTRRRLLVGGTAATTLAGGAWVAANKLGDDGPPPPSKRDADAGYRPDDKGGFGNRDESYASTEGSELELPRQLLYDTASKAAEATEVTVPTILSSDDPVLHLLRRSTFGPTPTLVDEVHAKGIDAWLAEQLNPTAIPDPTADEVWRMYPRASMAPRQIHGSVKRYGWDAMTDYVRATLGRQIWSQRQLFEVLVDFWANHLNVPMPTGGPWDVGPSYHNDVIRRHALGSFTDMLLAAMRHPAMLRYLNNAESDKESVNENLGRELLELHTVGISSGYTEDDVRNSAYILTGRTAWHATDDPAVAGTFRYQAEKHWTGPVHVLDFLHPNDNAAAGLDVGDAYLRHLASHPATAHNIARKLAVRFVADSPPDSLVERLASTYLESGTQIVPVLQVMFRSAELWAAVGQKTRRPLENVVATLRTLGVRPGANTPEALKHLMWVTHEMGHAPLGWPAPNGYPDVQPPWRSASGRLQLWNFHRRVVRGDIEGLTYPPLVELVAGRPAGTVAEAVDSLCKRLCLQGFRPEHHGALAGYVAPDANIPIGQSELANRPDRVEQLNALVLDSPYFALR